MNGEVVYSRDNGRMLEDKLAFIDRSQEAMCRTVLRIDRVVTRLEDNLDEMHGMEKTRLTRIEDKLDELLALLRTDDEAAQDREFTDGGMPNVFTVPPELTAEQRRRLHLARDAMQKIAGLPPINDPNGGRR